MELAYIFMICLSMAVFGVLFAYAFRSRRSAGVGSFMLQIVFVAVWSLGALFELLSASESGMLFWRNVQQIGVYFVPVTCVCFSVQYCRFARWKRVLPLLWVVPAIGLALLFTDQSHHLMRLGYVMGSSPVFGMALIAQPTPLGMLFIAYNFCIVVCSLVMLGLFAVRVSRQARPQVLLIMASIFIVFAFGFIKTAYLERNGVNIPIVVLYLPASLVLFYNLSRHRMLMTAPIAREKVFDVIEQGIIVTDVCGTIVDRNLYATHLMKTFFGIERELTGESMAEFFSAYPKWVELMAGHVSGELEVQSPLRDTSTLYIRIKAYPLLSDNGTPVGMVSLLRDITARRLQEYELRTRANMDSLTGLLNRSGFLSACRRVMDNTEEGGGPVSVLMIDLDGLKPINDTYGHFSGDKVLLSIADMLKGTLRQQDAIGRIGGDEFAAVLPGTARAEAMGIAERIRCEAAKLSIRMENGETIHITLSIGVCDSIGRMDEAEKLLGFADKAMYQAKRLSRNCCVAWE